MVRGAQGGVQQVARGAAHGLPLSSLARPCPWGWVLAVLSCLPAAAFGEAPDLPYLVAALDDPAEEVSNDAEGRLLLAGRAATPLLRAAIEDELARQASRTALLERCVQDLAHDDFARREGASAALAAAGQEAIPRLEQAVREGSEEAATRAHMILERVSKAPAPRPSQYLTRLVRLLASRPDDDCMPILAAFIAREPSHALGHYNLACGLSRLGQYDEALRAPDLAFRRGFGDAEIARKDPDLAGIRADPAFERILGRPRR